LEKIGNTEMVFYYYEKKSMLSKKSEYYLEFLKLNSKEGYEFEYFSEEKTDDSKSTIVLTLNVDCEVYVFGEEGKEEILEEMSKLSYNGFGYDSQVIILNIVNKDKFFNKYIIQLKEYLKKSIYGNSIQSVNFYRRKGSEIYPPEVTISIKSDIKIMSHEWFDSCVHIKSLLERYSHDKGFKQLEYVTPMSIMNHSVFGG
jgi:hypothetical protein